MIIIIMILIINIIIIMITIKHYKDDCKGDVPQKNKERRANGSAFGDLNKDECQIEEPAGPMLRTVRSALQVSGRMT